MLALVAQMLLWLLVKGACWMMGTERCLQSCNVWHQSCSRTSIYRCLLHLGGHFTSSAVLRLVESSLMQLAQEGDQHLSAG